MECQIQLINSLNINITYHINYIKFIRKLIWFCCKLYFSSSFHQTAKPSNVKKTNSVK